MLSINLAASTNKTCPVSKIFVSLFSKELSAKFRQYFNQEFYILANGTSCTLDILLSDPVELHRACLQFLLARSINIYLSIVSRHHALVHTI